MTMKLYNLISSLFANISCKKVFYFTFPYFNAVPILLEHCRFSSFLLESMYNYQKGFKSVVNYPKIKIINNKGKNKRCTWLDSSQWFRQAKDICLTHCYISWFFLCLYNHWPTFQQFGNQRPTFQQFLFLFVYAFTLMLNETLCL